jgi:hypothetical protein
LGKNPTATAVTLPSSKAEDNVTTNTVTATLDTATRNMQVVLQRAVTGMSKKYNNTEALIYTTALDDDHRSYGGEDDIRPGMKGDALENYEEKLRERKKEDKVKKLEYMKRSLRSDYDNISTYNEFTLNADGRTWRKQELNYTNKMELSDMIKVAGDNLLVAVPALIGDQLFISQEDRKRESDAFMRYPEAIRHVINFTIPAGYKAVGVQGLSQVIDNEVGTFAVQATVEGSTLSILVKKHYKQVSVKKEDWPRLVEMLDAAFNFSQKSVLLKKL